MKKVSEHVAAVISSSPFLAELLATKLGNVAEIARAIRKDVESATLTKVSQGAIVMALHRLPVRRRKEWGSRWLKDISDITLRSNIVLRYLSHSAKRDQELYRLLSEASKRHPESFCNVVYGARETVLIAHEETDAFWKKYLGAPDVREEVRGVTALTMRLPQASVGVPGVYYPILQAVSWAGISVFEIISVGTELTLIVGDNDVEGALRVVRNLQAR